MTLNYDHRVEGVDVCVDEDVLKLAPHCPHGPTLLFERFIPGKQTVQRYYACSACRDRKDCGFFQLYSDTQIISDTKKLMREEYNKSRQPWQQQSTFYQRFLETEQLAEEERRFCHVCNLLVLPDELTKHKRHHIRAGISPSELARPSFLLDAIENNKTNAQYLFSSKSVKFLAQTIRSLGFSRVLCVGVPRLHEHIFNDRSIGLDSLLLDIDHRYGQFYPPSQFCRYNMFNHFFLDGAQSQEVCCEFVTRGSGEGIVMITDPPFGGLVDALASGVKWLMDMWRTNVEVTGRVLPVMWIFPYFLEHRIVESLSGFKMLDYKVDYDNHPLFKTGPDAKKKGSPVRIFTNLDPSKIVLPSSEGYRFCKPCKHYVASENQHCTKCGVCPSKNGTTYRHCDHCNRCVKPSFVHCAKCSKCELATHDCDRPRQGCHVCGSLEHRRRDCPKRALKRSFNQKGEREGSKMKTWPKRKRKGPTMRASVKQFRPAEEQNVIGTPLAHAPAQPVIVGSNTMQSSPILQAAASSREEQGSSPSFFSFSSGNSLSSSVTGFSSDLAESRNRSADETFSSIEAVEGAGRFGTHLSNNDDNNNRNGTSGAGVRSKVVQQRPHEADNGQCDQGSGALSGTVIGGNGSPKQQRKPKGGSKKSKLLQKIQKMRMRRKIKLKI